MGTERRTYRSSFWTLWRWTTACCGLIGALVYGFCLLSGGPPQVAFPTAGLSLVLGTLFAVAVVCFPVYLSPEGLRCYNYWGLYRSIAWLEVGQISPESVLGLKYLRVTSRGSGAEVWLPLYLSDMSSFIEQTRHYAGPDHPLVEALERHRS
jgi:hypothetical protein